jgi:hypothetical protein
MKNFDKAWAKLPFAILLGVLTLLFRRLFSKILREVTRWKRNKTE